MALVAPLIFTLFFTHCQAGDVPPLNGVAVRVTDVPAQTEFAETATETFTIWIGLTVISIILDVAGFPVAQERLEVKIHLIK